MPSDPKLAESRVREKVRAIVYRTLGRTPTPSEARRRLVTESDVQELPFRGSFEVPSGALVTPLALQAMIERQIRLKGTSPKSVPEGSRGAGPVAAGRGPIALGADHAGFALKEDLKSFLTEAGYAVIDCGAAGTEPVDYPDFALAVAELVAQQRAERGIVVDGAGIGSSVAANKVPGVRAALCYDLATAVNSREHNDANVLTLGAGLIGGALARQIVRAWLDTRFAGGRHARRVEKITDIERRYLRR
ncbi:MAG TPA: ribose 5-phosphate isomerase B [Anaerolineales bacterium]|nr:ribose 5-phosphate isomerase B [Anaerolineales bacterium]